MISLQKYGWDNQLQNHLDTQKSSLKVGRVISIKGFKYWLITEYGELESELSGKLMFGSEQDDLPKVGDWVFYMPYEALGYIIEVFPRKNEVFRKVAGSKSDRQILAANVDYALIVQGLDQEFNLMRLERYLVQMINCRIQPIIILNKADLVTNQEEFRNEVEKLNRNCQVCFVSTYTGTGIQELKENVLKTGKTYILIGSSGVGKSSLLNALCSEDLQSVSNISDSTGKGRHTTTTRELFILPNGSLMIDTPGMREFGLAAGDDVPEASLFPGIEDVALTCKYVNCKHIDEAGCSVLKALDEGKISQESYESYLKLIKEQRRFEIKAGDKKRLGKQFGKMSREAQEYRKKYKF
jgi:ribosome biogenesis GTPase